MVPESKPARHFPEVRLSVNSAQKVQHKVRFYGFTTTPVRQKYGE